MSLFGRNRDLVAWTIWEKQLARSFGLTQIHRELKRPKVKPYSPPQRNWKVLWRERAWIAFAIGGAMMFTWLAMALVSYVLAVDEHMALWPFGG
jgi:hypothetical protein